MSQNTRNQPGERQGNSGRGSDQTQDRKNYEGFEGMNYEQIRRPYNPQHISNNNEITNEGGRKRPEEL